jgi:thioredoxin 1
VPKSATPVIVDFKEWCPPCHQVALLGKDCQRLHGKVIVAKVNTDENPEWVSYEISGIPTAVRCRRQDVYRQTGAVPFGY